MTILITGATGRVGGAVAALLKGHPDLRLTGHGRDSTALDFLDPATFGPALAGCKAVFLMRPPQIASGRAFRPFLDAALAAGVQRMVVLSVKGAESNPILPHHGVEREVMARGFDWTMLRPADFMQNLETVHRDALRQRSEIAVPAGDGRSAFIDVGDVAAVAAKVLLEPGHEGKGYTLTGPAALSFHEIAAILTDVLGRPIRYLPPGMLRFIRDRTAAGVPLGMAMVMTALYTVQRTGRAAGVTADVTRLLGRSAVDFRSYAQRHRRI
jgi:uncharacterized protein YbjT (DUF2867 family)